MRRWSDLAERVAATSRTSEKTALLAEYLRNLAPEELPIAAVFLTGRPFPEADQRAAGLGVNAWSDKDVVRGVYFPAVSLYMGATVKMNFGPDFWCVPGEVAKGVSCATFAAATAVADAASRGSPFVLSSSSCCCRGHPRHL